ncbi:MAG: DUF1697 domain-containing protein [Phycisphaerae bacterium]
MAKVAAFLRGINVGGKVMVPMAELKKAVESLGYAKVMTVLNSGNLVFEAGPKKSAAVEKELEGAIAKRFGLAVEVMVRGAAEMERVVAENPFKREAQEDPSHLVVLFLKEAAGRERAERLRAAIKGRERVEAKGREIFAVYPDGIGKSKLTNGVIEKAVEARATGRNWNTVVKLAGLLQG